MVTRETTTEEKKSCPAKYSRTNPVTIARMGKRNGKKSAGEDVLNGHTMQQNHHAT